LQTVRPVEHCWIKLLVLKGCGIEAESPVKRFDRPSAKAVAQVLCRTLSE
jgi:hypothetical protein